MNGVEVAGVRSKMEIDLSGYNSGIDKAKAKMGELGAQGKKTTAELVSIGTAFDKVGSNTEKIDQLVGVLDNINAKAEHQRQKLAELKESYDNTFNPAGKAKLQEQIVNTEAALLRLTESSDKTAKKILDLESASEATGDGLKKLSSSLKELGLSSAEISKIEESLKKANPQILERQITEVREEMTKLGASSAEIDKVTAAIEKNAKAASSAESEVKSLGIAYGAMAVAMTAIVTKSVQSSASFEQTVANLRSNMELSEGATDGLRKSIVSIGVQVPQTFEQVASVMEQLNISFGITDGALDGLTKKTLDYARINKVDAADSALALGRLINGLGKDVSEASAIMDMLTKAAHMSGLGVNELAGMITDAGPAFEELGFGLDRSIALFASFYKAGANPQELLSSLNIALNRMSKDGYRTAEEASVALGDAQLKLSDASLKVTEKTNALADAQRKSGQNSVTAQRASIELAKANSQLVTAQSELAAVQKTVSGGTMSAEQAFDSLLASIKNAPDLLTSITLATEAFGSRVGAKVADDIRAGRFEVDEWAESLRNAGGLVDKVADEQMDTLASATTQMEAAMESAGITVGDTFAPAVRVAAEMITAIVLGFNDMNPGLRTAIIAFTTITPIIVGATVAVIALNTALKATSISFGPIAGWALALGGLAAVIGGVTAAAREHTGVTLEQVKAEREQIAALDDLIARFDTLKNKPNKTTQEMTELRDVQIELARLNPQLTTSYDDLGNALIETSDKAKELSASLKETTRVKAYAAYLDAVAKVKDEEEKLGELREKMHKRSEEQNEKNSAFQKHLLYERSVMKKDEEDAYKATVEHMSELARKSAEQVDKQANYVKKLNESIAAWRQLNKEVSDGLSAQDLRSEQLAVRAAQRTRVKPDTAIASEETTSDEDSGTGGGGRTAEEIANERYRAEMKLLDYKRNMNFITEQEEVTALQRMSKSYAKFADIRMDLDVKIHRLKTQMEADAAKAAEKSAKDAEVAVKARFDASKNWIADEEIRMRRSGATETEIAEMKIAAWERVRNRYAENTEFFRQADHDLYEAQKRVIEQTTQLRIEALDKEREMKRKALVETQKHEAESARKAVDAEKEAFERIESVLRASIDAAKARYAEITDGLKAQISAIDDQIRKQTELDRIEERRQKRAELADKRTALLADKRYEKIVRLADGSLTTELVHDAEAVAEIDRQLSEMDREDERDAQRRALEERKRQLSEEIDAVNRKKDAEIDAINANIEALKMAKDVKIRIMSDELDALRITQAQQLDAYDTYWTSVLDKDQIAQDTRNEILQTGLDTALVKVTAHLDSVMATYRKSIADMIAMGSALNASLPMGTPSVTHNTNTTSNSTSIGTVNVNAATNNTVDKIIASAQKAAQYK